MKSTCFDIRSIMFTDFVKSINTNKRTIDLKKIVVRIEIVFIEVTIYLLSS